MTGGKNSRNGNRKLPKWFWEGCLVGFLILAAWAVRQTVYVVLFTDSIGYLSFARNILSGIHHGDGITLARYMYPPLYPHLIAIASKGNPDLFNLVETGRQVSVWAGALAVLPVYVLTRRIFDIRAAAASSFIMVLTPELLYYSGAVLTESTSAFFIVTAILYLWWFTEEGRERHKAHCLLLGALLGFAFMTRHAVIGFLPLFILWILGDRLAEKRSGEKAKAIGAAVIAGALMIAGFMASVSPQILYLRSETGRWSLTGNFMIDPLKAAEHAGTDIRYTAEREAVNSLTPDGRNYLFEIPGPVGQPGFISKLSGHPVKFLHAYITTVTGGLIRDTRDLPYPLIILILGLTGTIRLLNRRKIRGLAFIWLMYGGFYLFLGLFHNMRDRYMFPVLSLLVILSGAGASFIIVWVSERGVKIKAGTNIQMVGAAALSALIFAFLFPAATQLVENVNTRYDMGYYRAMHDELAPLVESGSYIFDRFPHRPFFAGARRALVPYDSIERVIEFGRYRGVRYWIVSDDYVGRFRPMFRPLLTEPERYAGDLKPLAVFGDEGSMKTILFKILP
jgi:4-amino-4-deoxy-L-arabinose transferase-like glycosyltransferase